MIPKIIHQTWSDDPLPQILKYIRDENIKLLKDKGYEFILWTDEMILKLINDNYPNFYKIYNSTKIGVQRGDIARLMIVYHYGGIYIDLDILLLKDIDSIVDFSKDRFNISLEPLEQTKMLYKIDKYICNAFFASNKNNRFLHKLLFTIPKIIDERGYNVFNIFDAFGGGYIYNTYNTYIYSNNTDENILQLQLQEDINIIYDRELIYPINDLKLENLITCAGDWNSVKNGKYPSDPVMIHYWIHGDFESKNLLNVFKPDINFDIHNNMFSFFNILYNNIAKKMIE
jgi:hypothetical protein